MLYVNLDKGIENRFYHVMNLHFFIKNFLLIENVRSLKINPSSTTQRDKIQYSRGVSFRSEALVDYFW